MRYKEKIDVHVFYYFLMKNGEVRRVESRPKRENYVVERMLRGEREQESIHYIHSPVTWKSRVFIGRCGYDRGPGRLAKIKALLNEAGESASVLEAQGARTVPRPGGNHAENVGS